MSNKPIQTIISQDTPPPLEDLRLSNLKEEKYDNGRYTWEKKYAVVAVFLKSRSLRQTSERTNIGYATLQNWQKQPWWEQMVKEIRDTLDAQQDNKLTEIINKACGTIEDRLENGEWVLNNKTGEMVRKPVNLRDATRAASELIAKREILRKNSVESIVAQATVQDTLKMLAAEFAKLSKQQSNVIELEETSDAVYEERSEASRSDAGNQ